MRRNSWSWVFNEEFTSYIFINLMTGRSTERDNTEWSPKAASEFCAYLNSRG